MSLFSAHPLLGAYVDRSDPLNLAEQPFVGDHGRVGRLIVVGLAHNDRVAYAWEVQVRAAIAYQWMWGRLFLRSRVRLRRVLHAHVAQRVAAPRVRHLCIYRAKIRGRDQRALSILLWHTMIETAIRRPSCTYGALRRAMLMSVYITTYLEIRLQWFSIGNWECTLFRVI